MKKRNIFMFGIIVGLTSMVIGCKDDTVTPTSDYSTVSLAAGFSTIGSSSSFSKTTAVDSMKIDSIIAVFQRIKFESHIESAIIDSTGKDTVEVEGDANFTFKGPFIIHVRDSNSVSFANQILPVGTYTGIKFKIHTLHHGDKFEDSDVHNRRVMTANNDSMMGYSIAVWGSVKRNGVWVSFVYKTSIEVEYKIRGNFTINVSSTSVNIALRFTTGDWFKNVRTGELLDPTITTSENRTNIDQAIKKSFEKGYGGKDSNNDGHPDA